MAEAFQRVAVPILAYWPILAYCLMPNHWTGEDGSQSSFGGLSIPDPFSAPFSAPEQFEASLN